MERRGRRGSGQELRLPVWGRGRATNPGEIGGGSRASLSLVRNGPAREALGSPVQQGRVRPGYDEVRVS